MFQEVKTFFHFLGKSYARKIQKLDQHLSRPMLQSMVDIGKKYFPKYSVTHWRKLDELLADFLPDYPFAITADKLPLDLLGVYVPLPKGHQKGIIILNTENSYGMHLSTIGHENGHLVAHLYREQTQGGSSLPMKAIYASSLDLQDKLEDPEELLADSIASMGVYPVESFKKVFCDRHQRLRLAYRKSTILLFGRATLYVIWNYPELARNFLKAEHKLFHACQTLHLARLRAFIYQTYQL